MRKFVKGTLSSSLKAKSFFLCLVLSAFAALMPVPALAQATPSSAFGEKFQSLEDSMKKLENNQQKIMQRQDEIMDFLRQLKIFINKH